MIWRWLFLAVLVAFVAIRARFHPQWAGVKREARHLDREKALAGAIALSHFVPAGLWLGTSALSAFDLPLPEWARGLGLAVCAGALGLLWWVHATLGVHFSPWLETWSGHALVRGGPYRWVRHPMYTSGFLLSLGYALLTANLVIGLVPALTLAVLVAVRLGDEEAMLEERFGEEYRAWRAKTGRLLPRLLR